MKMNLALAVEAMAEMAFFGYDPYNTADHLWQEAGKLMSYDVKEYDEMIDLPF